MAYTPHEWESGEVLTPAKLNTLTTAIGEMDMSYTPKTWHDGDILSAAEMNRIEEAVASGGGGGGGDFSTAEVTIIDNTDPNIEHIFNNFIIIEDGELVTSVQTYGGVERTKTIVLYDNYSHSWIETNDTITVTGDIEYDSDFGDLYITGDCTITIS